MLHISLIPLPWLWVLCAGVVNTHAVIMLQIIFEVIDVLPKSSKVIYTCECVTHFVDVFMLSFWLGLCFAPWPQLCDCPVSVVFWPPLVTKTTCSLLEETLAAEHRYIDIFSTYPLGPAFYRAV